MKHPTAMKKAQEEVRHVIGKKGFVDEDDIQLLTYLKAVIKETMRLQPAVPLLVPRENINGPSLTNPSVLNYNGKILVNLRNLNYILYHSETNKNEGHLVGRHTATLCAYRARI